MIIPDLDDLGVDIPGLELSLFLQKDVFLAKPEIVHGLSGRWGIEVEMDVL